MLNSFRTVLSHYTTPIAIASLFTLTTPVRIAPSRGVAIPTPMPGIVWRNLGPFRGGRVAAVTGAIGEIGTFYIGLPAGGVWKTTSGGQLWTPIFDDVKDVSSIGAVEAAPSNPNIVYVGTGDLITGGAINEGNGVYKSTDAGAHWTHIGLDASKQIPSIGVDPRNPDVLLVAAQGDVHVKSATRGVYRSVDGGTTWSKTLFVNDSTGAQKIAIAYDRPDVVFATTVNHYTPPPPPSGAAPASTPRAGAGSALFKSIDGGVTWKEMSGNGLPKLVGRTSVAIAIGTNAMRVYLVTNSGLYRSDDGGNSWRTMAASDTRIRNGQGGYSCGVYIDPKNPDVVYTLNTASYKSTDGGNTFTGFKGAPGGDDPQQMWIDPTNGQRMLFGYDQGAIVSLDGGGAWSSWYNQSTEQLYHISVDNSFPYYVYASQQDAGAIRTRSRGNLGAITPLDWDPVNGWEWGTVIADPLNPNTVFASGSGLVKISYPSEQYINVSPASNPALRLRANNSAPLVWNPFNQHQLLAGFQYLMSTIDGGAHWTKLSPELGYPKGVTPPSDTATPAPGTPPGGAIESISPSSVASGTIWVGTDNGLIKLTRDNGRTWTDVTIPGLPFPTRASMSSIDASHIDAATAYVAVDIHRTGEYAPYFYRTHDFGATWTRIVHGLPVNQPSGSFARVLRSDPKRKGLLVAGTESGMYVSFNDGDDWQSLMGNLPTTSYRDAVFKGNDLVVGTYGRGIWVLDDYAVLRQMTPAAADEAVHLFKPDLTVRIRRNIGWNTPFPPEVPHALNPPDGMIIWYALASAASGEVTMTVSDSTGAVVRHLSSVAGAPVSEAATPPHPNFWLAPPFILPVAAGLNRTTWDLRYDPPPAFSHSYEINANPGQTPVSPEGILAAPGTYTITLAVNGKSFTQTAVVGNDPRSPASPLELRAQGMLMRQMNANVQLAYTGYQQVAAVRTAINAAMPTDSTSETAKSLRAVRATLDSIGGGAEGGRGFGGRGGSRAQPTFQSVHGQLLGALSTQETGDLAPTQAMRDGAAATCHDLNTVTTRWRTFNAAPLSSVNVMLTKLGVKSVSLPAAVTVPMC